MDNKSVPRVILPKAEPSLSPRPPSLKSITPPVASGEEQSSKSSKRRCISSACMPCRRRKSKCDGRRPSCSACTSVYSSTCHYDIDSDHRRKGALKRNISQLKEELRAQTLILDALKMGSDIDVDNITQLIRAYPGEGYDSIARSVQKISLNKVKTEDSSSVGLESELASLSVTSVSDNTGVVGHYGHTSNMYMGGDTGQAMTITGDDQQGSWTTVTDNQELINHLLDLYFTWKHPYYLMFSEELFYHGLLNQKLKYCTPLLVNAILSIACHYSDRPGVQPEPDNQNTLGRLFFAEAKRLLQEDDRSCLTTIQALGIMSTENAMSGLDTKGWLYVGQMTAMTIQLSLHISVPPDGTMTPSEVEARRITFWGVFIMQTTWALCVGRISSIPQAAIRLEKPVVVPQYESTPWKPHGLASGASALHLEQASFKYTVMAHHALLSELVDDVLHLFYAPRDRITGRKLRLQHAKLQAWYDNLPNELRVHKDRPTLPQVLSIHAAYYNCVIHLFRPFLILEFIQDSKSPRQICNESADEISLLVRNYVRTYGSRHTMFMATHCIGSAAIIHLLNISKSYLGQQPGVKEQQEIFLADAIRTLYEAQGNAILVSKFLKSLESLIGKWCKEIPPRVREAMDYAKMGRETLVTEEFMPNSMPLANNTFLPTANHFAYPAPTPDTSTQPDASNSPFPDFTGIRKHSAPDLVKMAPPNPAALQGFSFTHVAEPHGGSTMAQFSNLQNPQQQELYWAPFGEANSALPLTVGDARDPNYPNQQGMGVTDLLWGQYPRLNRDGFMLGSVEDNNWGAHQWNNGGNGLGG